MPSADLLVRFAAILTLAVLAGVEVRSTRRNREVARRVRAAEGGDKDAERWAGAWLEHKARHPLWVAVALDWSILAVKLAVFILVVRALVEPSWITRSK